jgi:hypothetical protein
VEKNGRSLSDYGPWLRKSVPAGLMESSLPGKRVEFPDLPLSAFRRQQVLILLNTFGRNFRTKFAKVTNKNA